MKATSRQMQQAAEVLRRNAPQQTHEVRHACHEAIAVLMNFADSLDEFHVTRARLLKLTADAEAGVDRQTMDVITAPTRNATQRAMDADRTRMVPEPPYFPDEPVDADPLACDTLGKAGPVDPLDKATQVWPPQHGDPT